MSRSKSYRFSGLGWCLTLLFTACVSLPDQGLPPEPRRTLPDDFGNADLGSPHDSSPSTSELPWDVYFAEPELNALIEAALTGNQELNIRVQEILMAQYEVLGRSGEYLPKVGAVAGLGIEKVGVTTSQGASDEANGVPEDLENYSVGLAATWEVDIWKRLRNLTEAARARYLASVEGRNLLVTSLVAEIAGSYYELTALDNQLVVLDHNIAIQKDALDVVRLEKQAARVTELAVQRFEAEVLKNESKRYDLQQHIVEVENRIHFLIGRYPQPIARDPQAFEAALPGFTRAGLPAALLGNRPDIRRAELQLDAARLDVAAAKARFYPSLDIEAGVGYESFKSSLLTRSPDSLFYGLAGRLMAPLFNRRGIRAEYFVTIAEQWKTTIEYEQTVLQAYIEVANQLALIGNLDKAYGLKTRQVELLENAIDVSGVLFRSARADYMEVLLTRRDALEAEMERIETRLRQKLALVQVYRALGGGWQRPVD